MECVEYVERVKRKKYIVFKFLLLYSIIKKVSMSSVFEIVCFIPNRYSSMSYKIRNQIECIISTTTQYNENYYYCKCNTYKLSKNSFCIVTSHLVTKVIRTLQVYFPFIHFTIERKPNWTS